MTYDSRPFTDDALSDDAVAKRLSEAEVKAIVSQQPQVRPAVIVAAQFAVAVAGALVAFGLTQSGNSAKSAFIGGLIAAVPNALMAYGLTRSLLKGSVLGLFVWEAVKIFMTIALFAVVAVSVRGVEWVPMLLTFVVALKMVWVALIKIKARKN
jgi:ATP synthase protein I